MMTKKDLKRLLKKSKLTIITLNDWGKSKENGAFPYFNVYFMLSDYVIKKFIPDWTISRFYFCERKQAFKINRPYINKVDFLIYLLAKEVGLESRLSEFLEKTRFL